jgi:hypothetical protein
MKKSRHLFTCLVLIAVLSIVGYAVQKRQSAPGVDSSLRITVLNPAVASKMAERLPLASRLDSLDGKTIYMVDINWGGPEAALSIFEEMQAWFASNMPGVKTVIKMKKGGYEADDPALWKEIRDSNGNAAILGVSG